MARMQRPYFPYQGTSPRPDRFGSPFDRTGTMLPPPPPPPFGPRFGPYGSSPNAASAEFNSSRFAGGSPPYHTPCRPRSSPAYRQSPYQSPGQRGGHQGSPRTSTPFGSGHNRERGKNEVEKYYKPSMLKDPWADLQPVSVTEAQSQIHSPQVTNTGRKGRYYKN